ncbi:MAG: BrnT family toxin [Terracidiphilus sp.]
MGQDLTHYLEKHGVDFEEAATVFRDPLLLLQPDLEHSHEEDRWLALGKSTRHLLLVVVHTEDDQTIRLISARKAESKERKQYEQQS